MQQSSAWCVSVVWAPRSVLLCHVLSGSLSHKFANGVEGKMAAVQWPAATDGRWASSIQRSLVGWARPERARVTEEVGCTYYGAMQGRTRQAAYAGKWGLTLLSLGGLCRPFGV